jgi:DNA-binding transcriptional MerR regulator
MPPLTINEVSERLHVNKPTLRFWEKKFEGLIVPLRTEGGQRRYTDEHIRIIEQIKVLKDRGMRLTDIREELGRRSNDTNANQTQEKMDLLANRIAEVVKSVVSDFLTKET